MCKISPQKRNYGMRFHNEKSFLPVQHEQVNLRRFTLIELLVTTAQ